MSRVIKVFDTTLRDGEQSPGATLNVLEKLEIARALERLRVDAMEAGFPIASPGDFESVRTIAEEIRTVTIVALARAVEKDIDRAWEALKPAARPRIHTFIATSPIHMEYKLRKTPNEVLRMATEAVRYAKRFTEDVEFSAEDATRSDPEFLCKVFEEVINAGATVINIPDTVGYATPSEFHNLIRYVIEHTPNIDRAELSVHCHDDLGMAVANSLAAVQAGVHQVEVTINGIGERAGNAALEEVVMALKTRNDFFNATTLVDTRQIYRCSSLVSALTGLHVQVNKSIVGKNAFAHESGIHQDGVLKERATYEIMSPEDIGLTANRLVLGKHSGRHAFRKHLLELGYDLPEEELSRAYESFIELADRKKEVSDRDIEALIRGELTAVEDLYSLDYLHVSSGMTSIPTATVRLVREGQVFEEAACGDGPVDAAYRAVDRVVQMDATLEEYQLRAVTSGKDALGEVSVKVRVGERVYTGRGVSMDIIVASVRAYLNALNKAGSDLMRQLPKDSVCE